MVVCSVNIIMLMEMVVEHTDRAAVMEKSPAVAKVTPAISVFLVMLSYCFGPNCYETDNIPQIQTLPSDHELVKFSAWWWCAY